MNNFEQCTESFLKIEVQLIYNVLVLGVQQRDSDIYIYTHTHTHTYIYIFFSHIGYYEILNIVPCKKNLQIYSDGRVENRWQQD